MKYTVKISEKKDMFFVVSMSNAKEDKIESVHYRKEEAEAAAVEANDRLRYKEH